MFLAGKPTCDQSNHNPSYVAGGFTSFGLLRLDRGDTQSAAIKRRSRCGCVRGCPVLSSHFSPGPASQVGHTDSFYLSENRLFGLHDHKSWENTQKKNG